MDRERQNTRTNTVTIRVDSLRNNMFVGAAVANIFLEYYTRSNMDLLDSVEDR